MTETKLEKKARKREEAEARQKAHDSLTFQQKLAKAITGSREHKRLMNQAASNG